MQNEKWVSIWGNAVSIAENRPERYSKNITIRYPIHIPFSGNSLRLTFDNYCGSEAITLNKITVFYGGEFYKVLYNGCEYIFYLPAYQGMFCRLQWYYLIPRCVYHRYNICIILHRRHIYIYSLNIFGGISSGFFSTPTQQYRYA